MSWTTVLDKQSLPSTYEILEGIVQCQDCGEKYPIICGIVILVGSIKSHLAQKYSVIMSLAATQGIRQSMIAYLEKGAYDLHDTRYVSTTPTSTLGMSILILPQYDDLSSLIESTHPLARLVQEYCQRDLYTQLLELASLLLARIRVFSTLAVMSLVCHIDLPDPVSLFMGLIFRSELC